MLLSDGYISNGSYPGLGYNILKSAGRETFNQTLDKNGSRPILVTIHRTRSELDHFLLSDAMFRIAYLNIESHSITMRDLEGTFRLHNILLHACKSNRKLHVVEHIGVIAYAFCDRSDKDRNMVSFGDYLDDLHISPLHTAM